MSLNYEFTPIDVDITTHPKAFAAGTEAMGLWLWGQAYSKLHDTNGRIARAAALGAWGGRRNVMLAKRLVDAGLWIAREDGDWDVFNHEKKAPRLAGSPGALRTQRWRERKAVTPVTVTPETVTVSRGSVTCDVSASTSPSLSSGSVSGSSLASPTRVVIDDALRGWAGIAGAPEPTADHLAEFQLDAAKHGKVFADPVAAFKSWMLKQKRFDSDRRARARNGAGKNHVQSAENRAWVLPKDMP